MQPDRTTIHYNDNEPFIIVHFIMAVAQRLRVAPSGPHWVACFWIRPLFLCTHRWAKLNSLHHRYHGAEERDQNHSSLVLSLWHSGSRHNNCGTCGTKGPSVRMNFNNGTRQTWKKKEEIYDNSFTTVVLLLSAEEFMVCKRKYFPLQCQMSKFQNENKYFILCD